VRPANPTEANRDKVYALKILRKTEGTSTSMHLPAYLQMQTYSFATPT
jgi:hypothetical protein